MPTVASAAAECGYDGVELHFTFDPANPTLTNLHLTEPARVQTALGATAVTSVAIDLGALPAEGLEPFRQGIAAAGRVGASIVRLPGNPPLSAADLRSLGDAADRAGVVVTLPNGRASHAAVALWHRLADADHPAVGCCWDTAAAIRAGDDPAVAVPLLNSSIRCVRLGRPPATATVRLTLDRLAGIGYAGPLLVDWLDAPLPPDDARRALADASAAVAQWHGKPAQ